mmetsp:Transcript_34306/g.96688  ORF Transcript_34306/g.96688 Transcript_34306/m.96688 type:complete len:271 (+) Transcript_34306:432-1244(+)
MHPITAMETPGRWPVLAVIWAVTSCRSNSVRPQLGHDTYSVLVLRMRLPCSMANDVLRRNSRSAPSHSSITPSPRPSTSSAPPSVPPPMTSSSSPVPGANTRWWMTGTEQPAAARPSKTRREACTRLRGPVCRMAHTGCSASRPARSSAVSLPSRATASRSHPSGRAAPARAWARGTMATAPCTGWAWRSARGAMTHTSASCRRLRASRPASSEAGGTPRSTTESLVAMSLKGMPTASLHPRSLNSSSPRESSSPFTTLKTVPSRCSALE